MELQNCLVADNPTIESPHAAGLVGSWTNGGGNVIGGPALLSPLRHNGGPTLSLLPLPGSPAIDAGRLSDLVRDARGLSRLAGASPDAGAIESGATVLVDVDADGLPDLWERMHGLDAAIGYRGSGVPAAALTTPTGLSPESGLRACGLEHPAPLHVALDPNWQLAIRSWPFARPPLARAICL